MVSAMAFAPRPALDAFQDSPYAVELQRGESNRYSSPKIEAEYVQARLADGRMLIRIACLLTVLVTAIRGVEQAIGGWWDPKLRIHLGIVFAISVTLAAIAWSRLYERLYLPVARIGVPARNVVAAIPVAAAAAHGHVELLMVLPLMVLGPFFFVGLPFRPALVSVLLTAVAFVASAIVFGLDTALAMRTSVFLTLSVAACAMAAWQVEKHARKSFLESRLLAELAQLDPLTGMKNRRVLDEHLARIWQQAIDDSRTIAVLLIDVDHFKAYNDRYGHQAGDQTLRRVAHTLQSFVRRPLDVIARYGGEEFAAILYGVNAEEARETAERMRRAISDLAIEHRASRICAMVTISVGVAAITPAQRRKSRGALQLADEALYKAKSEGRNRVELMDETEYNVLITGVFARVNARGTES
jgi:diguanylate cyclase (GGDEF)-like protein